jgi:hypothetical protein
MNEVLGRDSPGAGKYETPLYTLSHSVMRNRGFPRVTEQRFQEDRLREKRFRNMPHTFMPEQFPQIKKSKVSRHSISHAEDTEYTNLIYDGFTRGKDCKFSKAKR